MPEINILIAEDEPIIALDLKRTLQKLGYQVVALADTGDGAVCAAEAHKPDLILMDVMLKGEMTGIDAASSIKKTLEIPLIFLTAHADRETLQQAKLTEPYGYLIKPVTEGDLYTTIETAFHRSRLEQQVRESEKRYRALVETISHGIVEFDTNGSIIFTNSAMSRITGYAPEELSGQSVWEIIHPAMTGDEAGNIISGLTLPAERPQSFADTITTREGGLINVQVDWNSKPLMKNGPPGFIAVITDFTAKYHAEDRLRQTLDRVQRTLGATVNALATTIERRDPYTAGHQQRVASLACAIAHKLQIPQDNIDGINIAALVHDIGKIHIPSEILSKPSRLSDIEFAMIKTHSQVGYEILKDIEFDWSVPDMVLQHHEKLDGSGYPGGLTGDEILFGARIITVADIVEAMASHRPYRPGLGIDIALDEIQKNRGKFYDSSVVDACVMLFREDSFQFSDIPGNKFT